MKETMTSIAIFLKLGQKMLNDRVFLDMSSDGVVYEGKKAILTDFY